MEVSLEPQFTNAVQDLHDEPEDGGYLLIIEMKNGVTKITTTKISPHGLSSRVEMPYKGASELESRSIQFTQFATTDKTYTEKK